MKPSAFLALFLCLCGCDQKPSDPEVKVSENESSDALAFYLKQRGTHPVIEVDSISWCARGQNVRGHTEGRADPLLDCSRRWLSWAPDGSSIPNRHPGAPFTWADAVNIGSYGQVLNILFRYPDGEERRWTGHQLLDADTGEEISFSAVSHTSTTIGRTNLTDGIPLAASNLDTGWVTFDMRDETAVSDKVILQVESKSENKIYRSAPISLTPDGKKLDWQFKAAPIEIASDAEFRAERALTLTYDSQNPIMLDLDTGASYPGFIKERSPETFALMQETGSDGFLISYPFGKGRTHPTCLSLANLIAYEITGDQYAALSPAEALKFLNEIKHAGGSYVLNRKHTNRPTCWVSVTKQNQVCLVKIPELQGKDSLQFALKSMQ